MKGSLISGVGTGINIIPSLITNYLQFSTKIYLVFDLEFVYYLSQTVIHFLVPAPLCPIQVSFGDLGNLGAICWFAPAGIWSYALGASIPFLPLPRNGRIRQAFYKLLGEPYVIQHLVNHPASKTTPRLAEPVVVVVTVDTISEWGQSLKNKHDADTYVSIMQKANKDPDPKGIEDLYRRESLFRDASRTVSSKMKPGEFSRIHPKFSIDY